MFSYLYDFFDAYELSKAVVISFGIVMMVRAWAYSIKDRTEKEEQIRELEDGKKKEKALKLIIPVSKSIHDENNCSICKEPIWTREGLEIKKGCTVELQCTHRFHWHCLTHTQSPSVISEKDYISYVMVDKAPSCPTCLYQPDYIEAEYRHKWQTVRFWVLLIDEALDQMATMSGRRGISWANIRIRAGHMSDLTKKQLAKGEEQTHGKADMLAEEDLGGPGQFPFFEALKDGNGERFQDPVDNVYHKSAGKWMTYHSDRGGERMVFKYSWGIPPATTCHNCLKSIDPVADALLAAAAITATVGADASTGAAGAGGGSGSDNSSSLALASASGEKDCKRCGHLGSKKLYWCSDECYATHADECKSLLNKFERFRMTKSSLPKSSLPVSS